MKSVRILTLAAVLLFSLGISVHAGDMGSPGLPSPPPPTTPCGDMGSPGVICNSSEPSDNTFVDFMVGAMLLY
jgi:hypothetical protein